MKNKLLLVLLAMVLVVSLSVLPACKAEEEEEEVEWQWPEKLLVASQGPASVGYPLDVAWTTPLGEDTDMMVRLITEENIPVQYTWLKKGELDVGFFDFGAFTTASAQEAFAARDLGPFQFAIIWPHGKGGRGYAVRGDSGIETPYDLKPGVRVIYHTFIGAAGEMFPKALLAWAQLDPEEDVEWVPAGSIQATSDLLKEGRGDVVIGWPSSPQWIEVEAAPHGLAWIELDAKADPEGAARLLEVDPSACFGVMTLGCPSAVGVPMIVTIPSIIAAADADPELIYNLVKWLDENHDLYKDAHPYCAAMTVDALMELAEIEFIPLHDGAVRYLEEIGLWTDAHEARRQQNIELIARYEQAFAEAVDLADEQGIEVDVTNEEWLELWENYKVELGLPPFKLFTSFP